MELQAWRSFDPPDFCPNPDTVFIRSVQRIRNKIPLKVTPLPAKEADDKTSCR
jgi:hypothetical protein